MEKIKSEDLIITDLKEEHLEIIKKFKSYEQELVNFLIEDAYNNQKQQISKTYLFFIKKELVAYVTLSNDSINLTSNLKKRFNKFPKLFFLSIIFFCNLGM